MASINYKNAEVTVVVKMIGPNGPIEHSYNFVESAVLIVNQPLSQYQNYQVTVIGQVAPPTVNDVLDYIERMEDAAEDVENYRCEGCGKTSRLVPHLPGCPVQEYWDKVNRV
jgi:hypothetical protein